MNQNTPLEFDFLRRELIGADAPIQTLFGERLMMHADYTASGLMIDTELVPEHARTNPEGFGFRIPVRISRSPDLQWW